MYQPAGSGSRARAGRLVEVGVERARLGRRPAPGAERADAHARGPGRRGRSSARRRRGPVAGLVTRTALTRTAPSAISRAARPRDLQKRACQSHLSRRIAGGSAAVMPAAGSPPELQRHQRGEGVVGVDRLLGPRRARRGGLLAAAAPRARARPRRGPFGFALVRPAGSRLALRAACALAPAARSRAASGRRALAADEDDRRSRSRLRPARPGCLGAPASSGASGTGAASPGRGTRDRPASGCGERLGSSARSSGASERRARPAARHVGRLRRLGRPGSAGHRDLRLAAHPARDHRARGLGAAARRRRGAPHGRRFGRVPSVAR